MKKRFLNLILALVLLICVLPVAASAACDECDYSILMDTFVAPTCQNEGSGRYKCSVCGRQTTNKPIPKLDHEPEEIPAVKATCTETGLTAGKKCSVCNEILTKQVVTSKLGHDHSVFVSVYKKPTCTESGLDTYKCVRCSQQTKKPTAALGHTEEVIAAVAPTCTETGLTAGKKCSVCNEILTKQVVTSKLPHDHSVFVSVYKKPTCTEGGLDTYKCKTCPQQTKKPTPALGHTSEVIPAVAPTCTASGTTEGSKCSVCGFVFTAPEKVSATGHNFEWISYVSGYEPTCTEGGKNRFQCTQCKGYKHEATGPLGHQMEVIEVFREASCTQSGCSRKSCKREGCGFTTLIEEAALGHKEKIMPAVTPTCSTTGLTEGKQCSVCNEVLTAQEVIRTTEHDWESFPAKEKTCTEDGNSEYQKCKICQTTQNKEVYPAGHNFVNFKCTVCEARDSSCEHKNASITTQKSTCTVAGKKMFTCPDCGYQFEEALPLAAHKELDKSVAATCTKKGLVHKVCKVCNVDLERYETDKIPHADVNGICTVCGKTTCKHKNTTTVTVDATCVQYGSVKETCNSCGKTTITELPLVPHNHVDGICTVCGHKDSNRITFDYQDVFLTGE